MKKIIKRTVVGLMLLSVGTVVGCTSFDKALKDIESDTKGLHRRVRVYADNGKLIEQYEDRNMLVTDGDGGTIQIDFGGRRITFCNANVVIEEV